MKPAPRVVLDTNVVLSALLFSQGRLVPIRGAWQRGVVRPLASRATIEELMRALAYPKFRLTPEDQRELVADYLPHCTTVRMPANLPGTPPCRDPFDFAFLQLAVVGKADYLVTGDKDLLLLAGETRCRIIASEAFLDLLAKS